MGACGGGSPARPVVIPAVAPGDFEAQCSDLCTPAPGDTLCSAKHAAFCLARCRVMTRDLPQGCAACMLAVNQHIHGYTDFGENYCSVGGPVSMVSCPRECDDLGAAPPAPELDTFCQLTCGFYMQESDAARVFGGAVGRLPVGVPRLGQQPRARVRAVRDRADASGSHLHRRGLRLRQRLQQQHQHLQNLVRHSAASVTTVLVVLRQRVIRVSWVSRKPAPWERTG